MKRRFGRRLAVLLAASLVMSSATFAYAAEPEEAVVNEAVVDEEAIEAVLEEALQSDTVEAIEADGTDTDAAAVDGDESGVVAEDGDVAEDDNAVIDEAAIDEAESELAAEIHADPKAVSDPSADPTTWSKDYWSVAHTYLQYIPQLVGYDDEDLISSDQIWNSKKLEKKAITPKELYDKIYGSYGISFNCIHVGGDTYVVYAWGIANEFDGYHAEEEYEQAVNKSDFYSPSRNNYYGMDIDKKAAGVFDYTPFTWSEKNGGSKANGKIIYEAAVINWTSGSKAVKNRIYYVDNLKYKNNLYATVSFSAVDGKWVKIKNKFQKSSKQPSFYPVFKTRKSYRKVDGTKVTATSAEKKYLKTINKTMKNSKIEFEIRRRPIASTVSGNYKNGVNRKYANLMGDDLDFTSSGKLKHANLQFVSTASKDYKNSKSDEDASTNKDTEAGTTSAKTQSMGYYLTHILKMTKMKDSEAGSADLENRIKAGEFHYKTRTDTWYTTKSIDGYDTLIVYGANNLEGIAAFRKRSDKSVGQGYYRNDKDCYIAEFDD